MISTDCIPMLLDVDTGVDDALALILALHAPKVNLVGITTTKGNTPCLQAALNTRFILEQFGMEESVPIVPGADVAMSDRDTPLAENVHGRDGLGGASERYWEHRTPPSFDLQGADRAADFILRTAEQYGSTLAIVATAPLTNIARAIEIDHDVLGQVGKLVVMGGAVDTKGNINKHAEFNAYCDPDAFAIVLRSHVPVTLFPLDVSERVKMMGHSVLHQEGIHSKTLQLIHSITESYKAFHEVKYGFDGTFIHDVLPVAGVLDPSLFEFESARLSVEGSSSRHAGRVRKHTKAHEGSQTEFATQVLAEGVLDLFWSQLRNSELECRFSAC